MKHHAMEPHVIDALKAKSHGRHLFPANDARFCTWQRRTVALFVVLALVVGAVVILSGQGS